ncbi:hypothetical protein K0M31_003952, partial [Melipona bicolor]
MEQESRNEEVAEESRDLDRCQLERVDSQSSNSIRIATGGGPWQVATRARDTSGGWKRRQIAAKFAERG